MQVMFVLQRFCQSYPYFRTRFIASFDFFLDADSLFLQQRFDDRQQILHAAGLLQLGDALLRVGTEQVQNTLFPRRERFRGHKVRIVFHQCFAFQFHTRRKGRLVHVSQRAEVIVGQPFPERKLLS